MVLRHVGNHEASSIVRLLTFPRPTGDFLIDYHPQYAGLFIATGDSGHVFKLFPVIGDKVADAIEGCLDEEYRSLWRWRDDLPDKFAGVDDGTRGGRRGMILEQEARRGMPRTHQ